MTPIAYQLSAAALFLSAAIPATAATQSADSTRPLELLELQRAARMHDARSAQRDMIQKISGASLKSIRYANRPSFAFSGNNSHLSDITHLSMALPSGNPPIPPKDTWSAAVTVSQLLYDGGTSGKRSQLQQRSSAESQAALDVALRPLQSEVTQNFFSLALLKATEDQLQLAAASIEQLLADTRVRVREGVATPGDSAAVKIEFLNILSRIEEVRSQQTSTAEMLTNLTGIKVTTSSKLAIPDWSEGVQDRLSPALLPYRPENALYQRSRERVDAQSALLSAEGRPRLVLFGSTGVGRPGLNQFDPDMAPWWQAGIKVEWKPFDWGGTARSREINELQKKILDTEEEAMNERWYRVSVASNAEANRLRIQLGIDEEIAVLREVALAEGEARRREGTITAADAVKLRTELADARLTRERHRIEMVFAQVRAIEDRGVYHTEGSQQ